MSIQQVFSSYLYTEPARIDRDIAINEGHVMFSIESAGISDRGRRRRDNQDRYYAGTTCFAVADGVGGNPGGDVAAQMAVDVLWSMAKRTSRFDLGRAVRTANAEIFLTGREHPELRHLCTTLTAVYIADTATNPHLYTVNVGDSRLYMLRNNTLTQLTTDDAVMGLVPGDQGVRSRRMLTRALGLHSNLDLQISDVALHNGDRLMLCTDGITNELSDAEIHAITSMQDPPRIVADRLVWAALAAGGRDNATAVVIDAQELHVPPHARRLTDQLAAA